MKKTIENEKAGLCRHCTLSASSSWYRVPKRIDPIIEEQGPVEWESCDCPGDRPCYTTVKNARLWAVKYDCDGKVFFDSPVFDKETRHVLLTYP